MPLSFVMKCNLITGMASIQSRFSQLLGKTLLTKKTQEKSLTSVEQSLMTGPNCQPAQRKDGRAVTLGQAWLL
jgi:hypothetical protein